MNITNEIILQTLKNVIDPDLKKDIVSLNMIDNIQIDGNNVSVTIKLTTPACPLKSDFVKQCNETIHKFIDESINVQVDFVADTTSSIHHRQDMLPGVKNIIVVASGKGGVGKSTIAVNLAIGLAKSGARVGLVDADIYGPSIPMMLGIQDVQPEIEETTDKTLIIPIEIYGIKILSIGLFIDPQKALIWRGPMASNAIKQLFTDAKWEELDYMIIDLPPGTGDIHLTIVQSLSITGAIVVSTPQEVALADARKALSMFSQPEINVPILGLVENMAWFTPTELPQNKYYLFGKEGCKKLAQEKNIKLLAQIPLIQSISESGDKGTPEILNANSLQSSAFMNLAAETARTVAIINNETNIKKEKV